MKNPIIKDALGWGILLWLFGYLLGIALFFVFPPSIIGWIIMPLGWILTLWVLIKKIHGTAFQYYLIIAIVWTLLAVLLDYFLLVKLFHPADGYYKIDVYIYYLFCFFSPLVIAYWKLHRSDADNVPDKKTQG